MVPSAGSRGLRIMETPRIGTGTQGARRDVPIPASRRNRRPLSPGPGPAPGPVLEFVTAPSPASPVEGPADPASAPRRGTPDRETPLSTRR